MDNLTPSLMRVLVRRCIAAALLSPLACGEATQPEIPSPFTLYGRPELRAGIDYAEMVEASKRAPVVGVFECEALPAGGKRCSATVAPGVLIVTVDGKGRVVHLKVETDPKLRGLQLNQQAEYHVSLAKGHFELMRDAWTVVNKPDMIPSEVERGAATFHWADADSLWSAGMWYQTLHTYTLPIWKSSMPRLRDSLAYLPDSAVIADDVGLREFMNLLGPPADPLERLRFDLEMLVSAQSEYHAAKGTFASTLDGLIFIAGDGVSIELRDASSAGWAAIGTHSALPGATCVLFSGRVPAPPRTGDGVTPGPGKVVCDRR